MAKEKTAKTDGADDRKGLIVSPKNVSLTPARIDESDLVGQTFNIPVPTEFADGEEVSTISPMANFGADDTKPGQYVHGVYQGFKEGVGPNNSRIYLLDIGGGQIIGVWGSKTLDNVFDFGNTKSGRKPKVGDKILIQYMGTVETKRGLNPAKIFRVRIAR